jgi:hypothetical protein
MNLLPMVHMPPRGLETLSKKETTECVIRRMLDTDSGACWTVIPMDGGHRFRSMLDTEGSLA